MATYNIGPYGDVFGSHVWINNNITPKSSFRIAVETAENGSEYVTVLDGNRILINRMLLGGDDILYWGAPGDTGTSIQLLSELYPLLNNILAFVQY